MPPATASAEFHQIETLAAAQRDFESRHAQLSPGRFRFRMRLADLGPLRIQANAVDGTYLCQARVRPGSWALFFPTDGPVGASRMNGLAQGRADGVLFGPGAELHARVVDGQRWAMAVLDEAGFRDQLDRLPGARAGGAVALPGLLARAPGLLRLAAGAARGAPGVAQAAVAAAAVEALRAELDGAFADDAPGDAPRAGRSAVRVTAAAVGYLEAAQGRAVFSEEVAAALGVSSRFVNLCFRAVYGTSLQRYLRACRLAEARRRLAAGGEGLLVKQVALDLGLWHFGRFARDYQALFGETPSETLAADRRGREAAGGRPGAWGR